MTSASSARRIRLWPLRSRRSLRALRTIALYLICWYLFDLATQALESNNVAIWNPPAALDIALLLVGGPWFTPVLALGTVIDQVFVTTQPWPLRVIVGIAAIRMLGYGGVCAFLLWVVRIDPRLRKLRDVVWFVVMASLAAPLLVALLQERVLLAAGQAQPAGWINRTLLQWAGIATGIVVFTPVLMFLLRAAPRLWGTATPAPLGLPKRWPAGRTTLECAAGVAALALGIFVAYGAPRGTELDYTYVVILPLVWIAVRFKLLGAMWAVLAINVGAAALVVGQVDQQQAFALQFGLMIVSQGGFVTGALLLQQQQQVTERLRLERALVETQKMESMGRLARGVAHDFNNVLQAVRGYIHLATLEAQDGADPQDSLREADRAVQRAADLAQHVLRQANGEAAHKVLADLNLLVRDTTTLVERSLPAAVTLDLHLDPTMPPVLADETQLRQVVLNLVVNAAEAMHGMPATITVSTAHGSAIQAPPPPHVRSIDRWICLTVADTGRGIAPDAQARMFEPFFSTKATGHGLGLGIVRGIVEEHGGDIAVQSVLGQGTTFWIWLPAAPNQYGSLIEA